MINCYSHPHFIIFILMSVSSILRSQNLLLTETYFLTTFWPSSMTMPRVASVAGVPCRV